MTRGRGIVWLLVSAAVLLSSPADGQQTGRGLQSRARVPGQLDFNRAAVARLISQNRYSEAIDLLEPVCRENTDRHDLTELLARCYLRSGRPGEAASLLEERLALAPGRLAFVKDLSAAYLDLGQKEKALALWESLLGDEEGDAARYGVVASMQWDAGMHDLSIETLRRGAAFPRFFESYMREVVRVQRVIGRKEEAFLTAVELFEGTEDRMKRQPGILIETWREAGEQLRLLAGVDSLGSFDSPSGRFFRIIGAILRARSGDFGQASRLVAGSDGLQLGPEEIYYFAAVLLEMDEHRRSPGYQGLYEDVLGVFAGRFSRSSVVPQMLLAASIFNMENGDDAAEEGGGARGPEAVRYYEKALSLADSAGRHPAARAFTGESGLIKARILIDRLYRPEEAMDILSGMAWKRRPEMLEAVELRLGAALATQRWDETESWLRDLEASGDTVMAAFGTYGRGMVELYRGRYEEAAGLLSSTAGEYPGSDWANDALSWAVTAKKATMGEGPATGLLVSALRRKSGGDFDGAIGVLERLAEEYPESALLPRAIWEKAMLLELYGRIAEAAGVLSGITSAFPDDVYAPRALERMGDIVSRTREGDGADAYRRLLDEYPGYPFISRVRAKYLVLQPREKQAGQEERGS